MLLLMFKLISNVISFFFLDGIATWILLAFTSMLICFNQLIASALSFSNDVFEFEKDFEK